jgi:hypothetical protein
VRALVAPNVLMLIRGKADALHCVGPFRSAGGPFHKDRLIQCFRPLPKGPPKQTPFPSNWGGVCHVQSINIPEVRSTIALRRSFGRPAAESDREIELKNLNNRYADLLPLNLLLAPMSGNGFNDRQQPFIAAKVSELVSKFLQFLGQRTICPALESNW